MKKILPIAVLAAGLAAAGTAYAGSSANSSGGVGTNVGDSMSEPMVVTSDNGNVRDQPNATAKILTTVPHGHRVTMIGTANGGAWAHVMVDGLDGYMDLVQLDKAPADATYGSSNQTPLRYMIVASDNGNVRAQPTNESALLVTLPRGSRITLLGSTASGWSHIQGNGVDGYIDSTTLADAGPVSAPLHRALRHGDLPAAADLPGSAVVPDDLSDLPDDLSDGLSDLSVFDDAQLSDAQL